MKQWWLGIFSASLFAAVFSAPATAQQITPSDGLQVPDASIATVGDGLALEVNPAGLAFMSRPELGYGFLLMLSVTYFSTTAMGLVTKHTVRPSRWEKIADRWLFIHIFLSVLVAGLALYHVFIVFLYE